MVGKRDEVSTQRGHWFAGFVGLVIALVPALATMWPAWWQDLDVRVRIALFVGWLLAALLALYVTVVQETKTDD